MYSLIYTGVFRHLRHTSDDWQMLLKLARMPRNGIVWKWAIIRNADGVVIAQSRGYYTE